MTIDLTEDQKLKRTFFHELGHFIAHELNFKNNVGQGADALYVKAEIDSNSIFVDYAGSTEFLRSDGYGCNNSNYINEYIAALIYGCIFESLYLKEETQKNLFFVQNCFCNDDKCNGYRDYQEFMVIGNGIPFNKKKQILELSEIHLVNLFSKTKHIEKLFQLENPEILDECNKEEKKCLKADISLLKRKLTGFLTEHKTYYDEFIKKIGEITDSFDIDEDCLNDSISSDIALIRLNSFFGTKIHSYEQLMRFNEYVQAFLIIWNIPIPIKDNIYITFLEQEAFYSKVIESFKKIGATQIVEALEEEKHAVNKKDLLNKVLTNTSEHINDLLYTFVKEHKTYFT